MLAQIKGVSKKKRQKHTILMPNQTSDNNKRIAKNTLLLYVRMFFMMGIALYTSRVVGHSSRGIIPRLIGL